MLFPSAKVGLNKAPKTINNRYSAGGVQSEAIYGSFVGYNEAVAVLSGALTAGTLKTLLTVTGSGIMNWISLVTQDSTARTVRLVVVVDGTTIFDATSNSISASNTGLIAVGWFGVSSSPPGGWMPMIDHLPFYSSLTIQAASSLSESNTLQLGYLYHGT